MTAEQIVDNPVPRPGGAGGLQGLHRGQSSTAFSEQIAFPIQVEVFKNFSQSRAPQRVLRFLLDKLVKWFFAPFYTGKKVAVELMDAMNLAGVWCRWLRH